MSESVWGALMTEDRRCRAQTAAGLQCARRWGATGTIVGAVLCPIHERAWESGKPITLFGTGKVMRRKVDPPSESDMLTTVRVLCPQGYVVVPQAEHDALMADRENLRLFRLSSRRYGPFEEAVKALWWRMHPVLSHEGTMGMFVSFDELERIKAAHAALAEAGLAQALPAGVEVVIGPEDPQRRGAIRRVSIAGCASDEWALRSDENVLSDVRRWTVLHNGVALFVEPRPEDEAVAEVRRMVAEEIALQFANAPRAALAKEPTANG